MDRFRNGDVVLWKVNDFSTLPRKILAKGIQLFEGTYYHHATIPCDGKMYEADKVVREINLSKYYGSEMLHFRLKKSLSLKEEVQYTNIIKKRLGAKYDFFGVLLWQPIYILSGRRFWFGKRGNNAEEKPYCTEFAIEPINQLRGYFPQKYKVGAYHLLEMAPLYYDLVYEGICKP